MSKRDNSYFIVMAVVFILLSVFVGGKSVEYLVEFWVPYFKGTPVDMPFFPAALVGLFVGSVAIPLALLTWACSFVL